MDTMLEHIKEKFDHNLSKKNLRERIQQQLAISVNGGLFKLTPELFSMLTLFQEQDGVVLEDSFGNPIKIENIQDFLYKSKLKYNEVMNEWLVEYDKIKRIRKPEQI